MPTSKQEWRCLKCGKQFTPQNDLYQCPECHSNSTLSLKRLKEIEEAQMNEEKRRQPPNARRCPSCGAEMVHGYLQEMTPLTIVSLYALAWRKVTPFPHKYYVDADACPSCGKVQMWLNPYDLRENPI